MELTTKKFIGGLVIGVILGAIVGIAIEGTMVLKHLEAIGQMTYDIRAIQSEQRDALNCQTWNDESCNNKDYWTN
jgi:hypothetical protein